MRISVLINTSNEARHLVDCIRSLGDLPDEIVVCDMESEDGCADLARSLGCKVISHKRMPAPEPEARIAAIDAASGDWILIFDPDMRIHARTARRLREIVQNDEADIIDFYRDNYYFGYHCPHGHGSQPVFRMMFKKSAFFPVSRNIHTFWHDSLSGRILRLGRDHALAHLCYDSVGQCVETLARYARREGEQARCLGIRPSVPRMIWRPVKRFLGNYFLRRGYRDGMPGLMISLLVSWYLFLIEAHLWEMASRGPDEKR